MREPADLARHNCLRYVFYPFGDEWRFIGPAGEPLSVKVKGNLLTNSAETLRVVSVHGGGLFLAPVFLVAEDLQHGRLIEVLKEYRPVDFAINAIYPHRHHLSAKVRSFLDLLAAHFASHQEWLRGNVAT